MIGISGGAVGEVGHLANGEIAVVYDFETKPFEQGQKTGGSAEPRAPSGFRAAKPRYRWERRAQAIFFARLELEASFTASPLIRLYYARECLAKDRKRPSAQPRNPFRLSTRFWASMHNPREQNSRTRILVRGRHPPFITAPVADSQRSLTRCSKRALARIAKGGGLIAKRSPAQRKQHQYRPDSSA